ncbi:MAG: 2-phospho-L-lactate transferase [Candidatus Heimdallarchaeaceae archaeon]
MIVFLSGGTGTPKLLQGFRALLPEKELSIIANTADDYVIYGLYVSPDIDTLLYLFSNMLDVTKFWGVEGDSFITLSFLKHFYDETWFNLGDKDLALHIFRTDMLAKGYLLSEIVNEISRRLSIEAKIIPSTDTHIETRIITPSGDLHFQEYWVKYGGKIEIEDVYVKGVKDAIVPEQVLEVLSVAKQIIIGPSNPVTSIGPILLLKQIYALLKKLREKVIVVSPLIGNQAISGPAVELMKAKGIEPNPIGISKYYSEIANTLIIDKTDQRLKETIKNETEMEVYVSNILFKSVDDSKKLAKLLLKIGD